jgi:hypothetical protein
MALQENKRFLKDPKPNMSIADKNMYLSAKLAVAPFRKLKIVKIQRIEIGATGWWIYHRTGKP